MKGPQPIQKNAVISAETRKKIRTTMEWSCRFTVPDIRMVDQDRGYFTARNINFLHVQGCTYAQVSGPAILANGLPGTAIRRATFIISGDTSYTPPLADAPPEIREVVAEALDVVHESFHASVARAEDETAEVKR